MSGVLSILRRVSRSIPNEDFIEFDDAVGAVAELIACTDRYLKADREVGDLKEFGGPDYALTREWREATCERSNSWCALRNSLDRAIGGAQ